MHLKPRCERKLLVNDIIEELRPKLSGFPGMRVYLQNPPTIRIGGQVTKSLYQFSMQAPDKAELYAAAEKLRDEIEKLPGVAGRHQRPADPDARKSTSTSIATKPPPCRSTRSRSRTPSTTPMARAGYPPFTRPSTNTRCCSSLMPQYQADPRALSLLYFKSNSGALIPLDTLAELHQDIGPANHQSLRAAPGGHDLVQPEARRIAGRRALQRVEDLADRLLPVTISTNFQGAAKAFQDSLSNLWILLIVAILVVYIVLGILYESYIHPLTILSGLPSAGFGALLTLYLFHMDLNIYAFVGLIMLIGIVKKNAIMQIDFALDAERNQGMTPTRGDLRRLPDPFPAHHDDHHGGAAGRGADRAGLRRGRRSAAAAGPGGGRRPAVLAARHAVSDAGGLHLHGGCVGSSPAA